MLPQLYLRTAFIRTSRTVEFAKLTLTHVDNDGACVLRLMENETFPQAVQAVHWVELYAFTLRPVAAETIESLRLRVRDSVCRVQELEDDSVRSADQLAREQMHSQSLAAENNELRAQVSVLEQHVACLEDARALSDRTQASPASIVEQRFAALEHKVESNDRAIRDLEARVSRQKMKFYLMPPPTTAATSKRRKTTERVAAVVVKQDREP